jgi:hypothetical protein
MLASWPAKKPFIRGIPDQATVRNATARVTPAYLPKGKSYTIGLHDVVRMCASNHPTTHQITGNKPRCR